MADISLSSNSIIRPYRTPWGSPQIRHFEESTCASSKVVKMGDVVTNNTVVSTGGFRIVRAPSSGGDGGNLMEVGIGSLIGVALGTSTGDGSTAGLMENGKGLNRAKFIPVALADQHTEFVGYLKGGLPAASSMIGQAKALIYDSTLHVFMVDSTNSTAALAAVRVTDIAADLHGDTNGAVVFKFLSSNYAF